MSRSINLLPDPVIDTQREFTKIFQGVIIAVVGLILFGLFNLVLLFLSLQVTKTLDDTQQQEATISQEIRGYSDVETKLRSLQGKLLDFQRIRQSDGNVRGIWQALFTARTDDMLFVDMTINSQRNVSVTANTVSLKNAVSFLLALRKEPSLANFNVVEINYNRSSHRYYFEISIVTHK